MQDLDLTALQHTKIGDERTGGLSRGQKRRVTVAIELITSPSVIFLDEPTSSLDAYSSLKLMQLLQKLAHRGGRTIVCTIHQVHPPTTLYTLQPRSDIFQLFDTLFMMVKGRVGYFGHVDRIASYFSTIGYPIPPRLNPADFIIDLTHGSDSPVVPPASIGMTVSCLLIAADVAAVEDAELEEVVSPDAKVLARGHHQHIIPPPSAAPPLIPPGRAPSEAIRMKIDLVRSVYDGPRASGGSRVHRPRNHSPPKTDAKLSTPATVSGKHHGGVSPSIGLSGRGNASGGKHHGLLAPIAHTTTGRSSRKASTETNMSDADSTYMLNHLGPIQHDMLYESYKNSSLAGENERELLDIHASSADVERNGDGREKPSRAFAISTFSQVKILITRSHLNSLRNPGFHVSWMVGAVSFLFYGLIYLGLRTSSLVDKIENDPTILDKLDAFDYWDSQRSFIFQFVTAIVFLQLETLTTGMFAGLLIRKYSALGEAIVSKRIFFWVLLCAIISYILDR